ncbi:MULTISPECIES: hypothetical protein [Myxococcus]|uniref:hypothetical protein n=1 Tax=Myxococcus TaxID=32 RepID=UPI0013D44811|nr:MULTISPECIES: hypothetical protein [Myxococcus]NVJ20014.1 hypothetical protein [Myxococcus sp. AM011]
MMSPILICQLAPRAFSPPVVAPPRPRHILDYLLVDGHMGDYSPPPVDALACRGANITLPQGDYFTPARGSLARVHYTFGNWNVFVPWPTVWLLRGQAYCPAPNRYGFAPSAEFGVPTFSGETSLRTDLVRVAPFAYPTMGAGLYTPEVDFVHGVPVTQSKYAQAARAIREGLSLEAAVAKYLS